MPEIVYEKAGTITLNGEQYQLIRDKEMGVPYQKTYKDEVPWSSGLPEIVSQRSVNWNGGGLVSYVDDDNSSVDTLSSTARLLRGTVNTTEYGINTDSRWPRRLVPGPKINSLTLPGNTSTIKYIFTSTDIWQVVGSPYIWVVAGNSVYYSGLGGSSDGDSAFIAYTDVTDPPVMGLQWQNDVYITTQSKKIFLADLNFDYIRPTGVGASNQFTPSAGANWQNVDDAGDPSAHDVDGTYNVSSTNGHIDLFGVGALPFSAVHGLGYVFPTITVRRTTSGGADASIRMVVRISGVNYFSAAIPVLAGSTSYATYFGTFTVNPATGAQWTKAAVEAAQWGYELTAIGGAGNIRVTWFGVSVANIHWITTDALADFLAVGPRRLFKVYDDGTSITLKNIAPAISPITEANWGDDVIIPGTQLSDTYVPLVAFQKTAIVATEKGVHGVDSDGTGTKIAERLTYAPITLGVQDPWLYISHGHGLSRWLPGLVQSVGIEQQIENESSIKGVMSAVTFLGKWTFAAITPPTGNNQILVGREADADTPNFGPVVWDTLIETGNSETIRHMAVGKFGSSFALCFEYGNNLGFCLFPETGGVPEIDNPNYLFVTSGIRYTSRYRFRDFRDKNFHKFLIRGKNLTANIYWDIAYQINDSGVWNTVDINGSNMRLSNDLLTEFILPLTAQGEYIQFRFTYTSNSASSRGWISYFEPMAVPQSKKIPELAFVMQLENNIRHAEHHIETRDVYEQLADLEALVESATPISSDGPWGDGVYVFPKEFRILGIKALQDSRDPVLTVQLSCQVRE